MSARLGQPTLSRRRLLLVAAAQAAWLMGCGDDNATPAASDTGLLPDNGDVPDADVPDGALDAADVGDTEDTPETTELPDVEPVDPEVRAELEAAIDAVATRAEAYFGNEALALLVPLAAAWLDTAGDVEVLARLTPTFALLGDDSCDVDCLRNAVRDDFDAGATDDVEGWTLGRTELALAAIATWDPRAA